MHHARIALVFLLLTLAPAGAQDSITLRPEAPRAEKLADIATLDGPAAESLAAIDISHAVEQSGPSRLVTVDSLRTVLEDVPRINWGKLTLTGTRCLLIERPVEPPHTPIEPKAPETTAVEPATGQPGGLTVRDLIAARLAEALNVDPGDLRLAFDETRTETLDARVAGLTADIQPVGVSDRQVVSVKLFEGSSIRIQETVRATVTVRRTVAVAGAPVARGQLLSASAYSVEERWLPPSVRAVAVDSLERFIARVGIRPGEIIRDSHTEQPLVIRKGDLVDIHCISGSIHMKIVARALEPAKEGQTVRFQATDSKRTLSARADGPRRAVADVTEAPGAQAPSEEARAQPAVDPLAAKSRSTRGSRYAKLADRPIAPAPETPARETKPGVTPR